MDRIAVIDIGSNSVRLMMSLSGKTLYKKVMITRLSQNMREDGSLSFESAERTASAVLRFYEDAKADGADKIYAFATAACRNAKNGKEFAKSVYDRCGLEIDIVDGETEAQIGFLGATGGRDGGVIDIGGASTEVMVVSNGNTYAKSVNVGVVKLYEWANNDKAKTEEIVDKKILEYGKIPSGEFYAIGGTATSLAAVMQSLCPYDPEKVHGYRLNLTDLENLENELYALTVEEKRNLKGLQKERAEVIAGGATLLIRLMKKLGVKAVTVSESDNMEGYLLKVRENI